MGTEEFWAVVTDLAQATMGQPSGSNRNLALMLVMSGARLAWLLDRGEDRSIVDEICCARNLVQALLLRQGLTSN